jgi:hypothetical protein
VTDFLVRGIDEAVMLRLKERARRNGRSLQQEVHDALERATRPAPSEIERSLAELDARHGGIPAEIDLNALLREERDDRGWM